MLTHNLHEGNTAKPFKAKIKTLSPSSEYQPSPNDEILWLCERCHVSEGGLNEAERWVAQEVSIQAGIGGRNSFGGITNLLGVWGQVVGGVQVEVCDVPKPPWTDEVMVNDQKQKLEWNQIKNLFDF